MPRSDYAVGRMGPLLQAKLAEKILDPLDDWARQCHAASIKLVTSGEFGTCRVARGSCVGVGGQHSWVVLGNDCYRDTATIIDPTLWSYDESVDGVWVGTMRDGRHRPHGAGLIWEYGRPPSAVERGEEPMDLTPTKPWSSAAEVFLGLLGPLSKQGWIELAHYPVEGWPAGEIIEAMIESGLEGYIPIDRVGMLTDRNPNGLYLP
jgi:hypothetical protein